MDSWKLHIDFFAPIIERTAQHWKTFEKEWFVCVSEEKLLSGVETQADYSQ